MVRKSLTPFKAANSETILGVKKAATPKSEKKVLTKNTPKTATGSASISKKKKSMLSSSFSVSEVTEEVVPGASETPTLTGKKKKRSLLVNTPQICTDSPVGVLSRKKKISLAEESVAVNTPNSGKKQKKKSLIVSPVPEEKNQTPTSAMKKKKKMSLASKQVVDIQPEEVSSSNVEESTPGKKRKNKKSEGVTSEVVQSPSKKKKLAKGQNAEAVADDATTDKKEQKKGGLDSNVDQKNPETGKKSPQPKKNKKKEIKRAAYTVFVGNLTYDTTEEEVREHFGRTGLNLTRVFFPKDKETNLSRGFAYVDLPDGDQYNRAMKLDRTFIKTRRIRVQYTMPGNKKNQVRSRIIKSKILKFGAMQRKGIELK